MSQYSEKYTKRNERERVPETLSRLVSELINIESVNDIYDPCCGAGELLLSLQNHCNSIYGEEVDRNLWAYAKLQFALKKEDATHLRNTSCIREPAFTESTGLVKQFDVVVSCPQYAHHSWGYEDIIDDQYNRFVYGNPPKSTGDYGYISHMLASTKPGSGMALVILPQGVLYRGAKEALLREQLIRENVLDTVIVLPEKLLSGTLQPLVVLVFKYSKKDKNVLFIDASHSYTASKMLNTIESVHIEQITHAYQSRQSINKYSRLVPFNEIEANNFNCNIPRYIDTSELIQPMPLVDLDNKRKALLKELADVDLIISAQLDSVLK